MHQVTFMGKEYPQFICWYMENVSLLQVENSEVARRILNDPASYTPKFSKQCKDLCEGLMEKNPAKRLGFKNNDCEELKNQPFFKEINWGRLEAGGRHLKKKIIHTQKCITGSTSIQII